MRWKGPALGLLLLLAYLLAAPRYCELEPDWSQRVRVRSGHPLAAVLFWPWVQACNRTPAGWVLKPWMELWPPPHPEV